MEVVILMVEAAYIHIPFCEQICHYCDFNKVFLKGQPVNEYLVALDREIENTVKTFPYKNLATIFVGGGTPTALNMEQLEKLLSSIRKHLVRDDQVLEFTFEANPGDLSKEKLQLLLDGGVNRLSLGVQTFDNEMLAKIGRSHRKEDVFHSIDLANEVGFHNINVDLIYSLPGQTKENFKETLNTAFTLDVTHFSCYSLIIEPKTVFYNLMRKGKLPIPPQEIEAEMFALLMEIMGYNGFEQYEISNFSKRGFESQHNLTYWNNEEYYGFGAGAHSYISGSRRVNAGPLKKYLTKVSESGLSCVESHPVTQWEKMEEEMFLGLRKTEGVSKEKFLKKFNVGMYEVFGEQIIDQKQKGLLEENNNVIRLTRKGMFLGNEVFQAFLVESNR